MARRNQGQMDPDRYQMRDLKRRVSKLEKEAENLRKYGLGPLRERIAELEMVVDNLVLKTKWISPPPPVEGVNVVNVNDVNVSD